jgi:hypothetical protein
MLDNQLRNGQPLTSAMSMLDEKKELARTEGMISSGELEEKRRRYSERISRKVALQQERGQRTLVSITGDAYRWLQETFPTVTAVVAHLPFALVPFALSMFVLVQALATKGWIPVFAYGWDHWVNKTGTLGSIGGMGFLSVILCNVSFRINTNGQDSYWM